MICAYILCVVALSACSNAETKVENNRVKIGIMLSDAGLGNQSFSDLGFAGLEKARDELGISFDYRECKIQRLMNKVLKS